MKTFSTLWMLIWSSWALWWIIVSASACDANYFACHYFFPHFFLLDSILPLSFFTGSWYANDFNEVTLCHCFPEALALFIHLHLMLVHMWDSFATWFYSGLSILTLSLTAFISNWIMWLSSSLNPLETLLQKLLSFSLCEWHSWPRPCAGQKRENAGQQVCLLSQGSIRKCQILSRERRIDHSCLTLAL